MCRENIANGIRLEKLRIYANIYGFVISSFIYKYAYVY